MKKLIGLLLIGSLWSVSIYAVEGESKRISSNGLKVSIQSKDIQTKRKLESLTLKVRDSIQAKTLNKENFNNLYQAKTLNEENFNNLYQETNSNSLTTFAAVNKDMSFYLRIHDVLESVERIFHHSTSDGEGGARYWRRSNQIYSLVALSISENYRSHIEEAADVNPAIAEWLTIISDIFYKLAKDRTPGFADYHMGKTEEIVGYFKMVQPLSRDIRKKIRGLIRRLQ